MREQQHLDGPTEEPNVNICTLHGGVWAGNSVGHLSNTRRGCTANGFITVLNHWDIHRLASINIASINVHYYSIQAEKQ